MHRHIQQYNAIEQYLQHVCVACALAVLNNVKNRFMWFASNLHQITTFVPLHSSIAPYLDTFVLIASLVWIFYYFCYLYVCTCTFSLCIVAYISLSNENSHPPKLQPHKPILDLPTMEEQKTEMTWERPKKCLWFCHYFNICIQFYPCLFCFFRSSTFHFQKPLSAY